QSNMTYILSTIILAVCLALLMNTKWLAHFSSKLKSPKSEGRKPTLFDVRQFIIEGDVEIAIELYREIFKVSYEDSKTAVSELAKSIHPNLDN
ncbi:MAG: hypothetical protein KC713_10630, partial [Candidatus Omnitrophica bacterium]|nr:hypothetical protein [Candidatus Omnitrophota bacterium]